MKTRITSLAVAVAALVATATAFAADRDHPAVQRALAHLRAQAAAAHASDADAFAPRDLIVDRDGSTHVRLARSHRGLPVIGGDLVVHSDARGAFRGVSQTLRQALQLDTEPRHTQAEAIAHADSLFGGAREGASQARLVVYARGDTPRLAWDVTIRGEDAEGTPSVLHHVVDADTLELLDRFDEVMTNASAGTAKTLLSGAVGITTDSQTGGYALRDPNRSDSFTATMANKRFGAGTLLTDADNIWGSFATSDAATVAGDAHYGMALTWDYYANEHGRDGIDDAGSTTSSRVHYGRRYANAFWSDTCFCMTYGDGNGTSILPLVAIDIAGHEMSHGVTSRTAGLIYSGESGGLNEANSDIFGAMVEYYANNAKNPPNYLVGERIYKVNNGVPNPTTALRYMFKPSLDGQSPDCHSPGIGSLDVHYSSGVANHFYYLLAEGAVVPSGFALTPSQLVCNGNTAITGIGRVAASKIWYRALTVYMTSNTDYADARSATLAAAADLYGAGSAQHNAVAAAWSAVSVN